MKFKYFLISFLTLVVSVSSVSIILLAYFRAERLAALDEQIRLAATAIIDSKLSEIRTYDDEETDYLISDELGPDRLGKFFIVKSGDGEVLFETQNIALLEVKIPEDQKWLTLNVGKHFIRVLNLNLPKYPNRTLQVGSIQSASVESLTYISKRTAAVIAAILLLVLVLTWGLSAYLFSPIQTLANYLSQITRSLESNTEIPKLEGQDRFQKYDDELRRLMKALDEMVNKLNSSHRFMKSWSFQMAHELKTPLTVLNRDIELLVQKYQVEPSRVQDLEKNVAKISHTISSFLDWGDLISRKKTGDLYVISVASSLKNISSELQKVYGDRIQIVELKNFSVVVNPLHFEQMIENILVNALKYSQGVVSIEIHENLLVVQDQGPGISENVLAKIGSPFNRGEERREQKGVGLGLAWVRAICEIYYWDWDIQINEGTQFRIKFPPIEADEN